MGEGEREWGREGEREGGGHSDTHIMHIFLTCWPLLSVIMTGKSLNSGGGRGWVAMTATVGGASPCTTAGTSPWMNVQ